MSKQSRCETLTDNELEQGLLKDTKLDRKYRVEWGQGPDYTLICDDEDTRKPYQRHSGDVIALMPLRKMDRTFISVGLDHNICVSSFNGRQQHLLTGHDDRIIGLIELDKGKLLSVAKDNTVRVWDLFVGRELSVMEAEVAELSCIKLFSNSEKLAITEPKDVTIWSFAGEKVAVMQGLKSAINEVFTLDDGSWLIKTVKNPPSIWSATGKFLHQFRFDFSFEEDLAELDGNRLLIRRDSSISLWSTEGELLSSHEADDDLVAAFNTLKKGQRDSRNHMADHPEIIDYPHLRNPLHLPHSRFNAREELESQDLKLSGERKMFWDFFNRPLFEPVKTAMKGTIASARRQLRKLDDKQQATAEERDLAERKRNGAARWSWLFLILTLALAGTGYLAFIGNTQVMDLARQVVTEQLDAPRLAGKRDFYLVVAVLFGAAAGVMLLLGLILFGRNRKHRRRQLQLEENLAVQAVMAPAYHSMIKRIKAYRRNLLSQIPIFSDNELFAGRKVSEAINHQIDNKLKQMAMDECGLEKKEIIYTDHEAIVLADWALIQDDDKRRQVKSKLNLSNELSFWTGADKQILFAVQYVQYIFLTEDKVDVFTTYYDFIAGKCIGKEANAFYYKDVTNVAKRDVDRSNGYNADNGSISATEITLSVASGERIRLTILNEDSVSSMANDAKDNESTSIEVRIEQLEQDRREILEDADMDEEEREEELAMIDAHMTDLHNQDVAQDTTASSTKAEETVRNIRKQLHDHKQHNRTEVKI
ncbi:WD40 repeat domain-containing protein [Ferrimonas futtsuensis]|uniref:WD40 repeat domain-containing protein n=1 Tax=Ferrimonas futtsuensis TaxID=364764 RepID=UPI00040C18C2|nr:hypothetical protein [Ferrimonas futtsuensis]